MSPAGRPLQGVGADQTVGTQPAAPPVGPRKAVVVEVGGLAHFIGESRFRFDDDDPLREGFTLSS